MAENKNRVAFAGHGGTGLTKREYAAIQIMAAFASDPEPGNLYTAATSAVRWADALFDALDEKDDGT